MDALIRKQIEDMIRDVEEGNLNIREFAQAVMEIYFKIHKLNKITPEKFYTTYLAG